MKKGIFLILCFLFIGNINAKVLDVEEVIDGFLNTTLIKQTNSYAQDNEKISVVANDDNKTFDIYMGSELLRSYSYRDGYIYFSDDSEITEEVANNQFYDFILLGSFIEGVVNKSGFNFETLNDVPEDFVFDFDKYGIEIQSEHYEFSSGSEEEGYQSISGDFFRVVKIGFDTEKIATFVNTIGIKEQEEEEDLSKIVPTIKVVKKDKKSVELNVFIDSSDSSKTYYCNILRSTNKDSGYKDIFALPVECSDKDLKVVDNNIKDNTTYYYKAIVVGGSKYSNILKVSIGSKIVNPKTGDSNQFIPLLIGFVVMLSFVFYLNKNNSYEL